MSSSTPTTTEAVRRTFIDALDAATNVTLVMLPGGRNLPVTTGRCLKVINTAGVKDARNGFGQATKSEWWVGRANAVRILASADVVER